MKITMLLSPDDDDEDDDGDAMRNIHTTGLRCSGYGLFGID